MIILQKHKYMRLEKQGKRAWITFTRPKKLNALNNEGTRQLLAVTRALKEDPDIRVVIIQGEGRAFCTGIDLTEYASDQIEMGYHRRFEAALRLLETMEKIVVVGMHGYCLGGGLQLSLAADIRVSTDQCIIGLPAIKESLIPGLSTWRLPRYIGWGRAKRMVLGGENITGKDAQNMGLVDHIAAEDDFKNHLDKIANHYLAACSTGNRMSKLMLGQAFDMDYDQALSRYFDLQERAQFSLDAQEARRAYKAGEDPSWQ